MIFSYSHTFLKHLKTYAHQPKIKQKINTVIRDFQAHTFKSQYYRKKLKGYGDTHELYVTGDIRILIKIIIIDNECRFIAI